MITTAFVLGAGLGTRLRPLTENLPKPLLPVGGRPLVTWAFDHCLTAGVARFIVNTHHCPAAWGAAFPAGHWRGRPILFRHEPVLLDTAGGIKNIEDLLDGPEPLLVYNGDILSDLPLTELLAAHAAGGAEATLALRSAGLVRNVALDAGDRVCDLRGLLGNPGVRQCQFTGISIVERRFLARLTAGQVESTIPVFARMIREAPGTVGGVVIDGGRWLDIGDRESYGQVREGGLVKEGRGARGAFPGQGPVASPGGGDGAALKTAGGLDAQPWRATATGRAGGGDGPEPGTAADGEADPAGDAAFVRAALGLPAGAALTLTPVGQGGSDRTYRRVGVDSRPLAVLMRYGRLYRENDLWAAVAEFLAAAGVAVPAVYACDPRRRLILLEDLGDGDLYGLRDAPWERRRGLYEKTLALATRLHALSPAALPPGLTLMPGFDGSLYRWERDYFRERFVRDFCGIEPAAAEAAALEAELAALAGRLLAAPPCLVHRDLQSQNVMLRGGEPVLIDFQGLRPGHRGYDLASLLWDPYVPFPDGAREALLAFYGKAAGEAGGDAALPSFLAASAQRLMQALGAYGFLGLVRRKPHFLAHIPRALENLLAVTDGAGNLPRLRALTERCRRAVAERGLPPSPGAGTAGPGEEAAAPTGEGTGKAGTPRGGACR